MWHPNKVLCVSWHQLHASITSSFRLQNLLIRRLTSATQSARMRFDFLYVHIRAPSNKQIQIILIWTYWYPVLKLITGIRWIKLLQIQFCSVLDSWHFPQFPPRYIYMLMTAMFYDISGSSPTHPSCTSYMPHKVMQLQ